MMFGLCNQTLIKWFTVQNYSDNCNFVAVVTAAKTVLSNAFFDSMVLQVSELWPKAFQEDFVYLVACSGTVYQ